MSELKQAGKEIAVRAVPWVIGAGVLFVVLRVIGQKIGLIETKESKEFDKQSQTFSSSKDSAFSPTYYKNVIGAHLVTRATAQQLAKKIYDADDLTDDDENDVYAALRQLQYKTQVSWLADVFNQMYQQDLYGYMRSFLDDNEMNVVHAIVNQMK